MHSGGMRAHRKTGEIVNVAPVITSYWGPLCWRTSRSWPIVQGVDLGSCRVTPTFLCQRRTVLRPSRPSIRCDSQSGCVHGLETNGRVQEGTLGMMWSRCGSMTGSLPGASPPVDVEH
jgi:hypothetical protein